MPSRADSVFGPDVSPDDTYGPATDALDGVTACCSVRPSYPWVRPCWRFWWSSRSSRGGDDDHRPGGISITIALYGFTSLSAGGIAGTAHLLFVATGVLASSAYARSGDLSTGDTTWGALLCGGSVAGALVGVWLNQFVARELFGLLLGTLAGVTGLVIVYRERRGVITTETLDRNTTGRAGYVALGVAPGTASGLLGVGGPVVAVPALVIAGVPMLAAVAVAQAQSVFLATFSALGYLSQGAASVTLAAVPGVPLLAGVVVGWRVAHRVDPNRSKVALGLVVAAVAPYLAFRGAEYVRR